MKKGKKKEGLKITRRQFLKGAAAAGIGMALPLKFGVGTAHAFAQSPNLTKFVDPMRGIGGSGIPIATSDGTRIWTGPNGGTITANHYTIGISQFNDVLHSDFTNPAKAAYIPNFSGTKLWGFGQGTTYKHLGGIIATKRDVPVQVTFQNNLPATNIIPVDITIPGANQAQNRTAVHVHGGYVPWISDGGPHDWWNPGGSHGLSFLNNSVLNPGAALNEAEYYYPNQQSARLVWYHDHAWGITRINAYAGIASGYVIYDDYETVMLAANPYNLPGPLDPRTIYLIFQDKIFVSANIATIDPTWPTIMPGSGTGDLWYAHVYDPARWVLGPTPLGAPPDPSVIPEYFGDTMLVNGTAYPFLEVEQTQYRFRLLNACNARFLTPRLVYAQSNVVGSVASTEPSANVAGPAFIQIGTEGGFLPAPAMLNGPKQPILLMAPAERADLIIDFSAVPAGSILLLYNDAPAPFPKGDGRNDYYPKNPKTPSSIPGFGPNTRTIMQFRVKAKPPGVTYPLISLPASFTPTDPFLVTQTPGVPIAPVVNALTGTAPVTLANGTTTVTAKVRYLTLNEAFDGHGRLIQYLGTNVSIGLGGPGLFGREYMDLPTEVVNKGDYEIWEIANLTGDTHPIHFHLVNVQILSRQPFQVKTYKGVPNYLGPSIAPDNNELGWKETVRMNPGEVTRVFMQFTLPAVPFTVPVSPRTGDNEYVWHCHILEHEEHDMMRPLVVVGANPTI